MKVLIVVVLVLVSGCSYQAEVDRGLEPRPTEQPGFTLVPKPDPKVYSRANTLEKWTNPFLFVHPDGVELIAGNGRPRGPHLSVAEIETRLALLPVDAWPLGRAVAVQQNALGSGPEQDEVLKALRAMLESHDIAINWWPTA
jgi:hypothetical protein